MRVALVALSLGALLVLAVGLSAHVWSDIGEVEIGLNGMLALSLGALLSLGLGVGLMALVFYSSRSGHDESVNRHRE